MTEKFDPQFEPPKHEIACDEQHAHTRIGIKYSVEARCCTTGCLGCRWETTLSWIVTKCICQHQGREIEYMVTDQNCFIHGTWNQGTLRRLSQRLRILYDWYHAPYMSTKGEEAEWWFQRLGIDDAL